MASSETRKIHVAYKAPADLRPDPRNARTHSKKQVGQIAASIGQFGFTNPILVDKDDNIVAGHGRLRAAKELGLAEVPTITLHGLSDEQIRLLRLADNKIASNAGWDVELLTQELGELSALAIDLGVTGFAAGEIEVLLDTADPDDEDIPVAATKERAQVGDIWVLGPHRIGCGDARDVDFLTKVVGDGLKVDAAFLDPPYNVRIGGHANIKRRHREFQMASGEMSELQFRDFLSKTLGTCVSVSKDGAVHFICMDWRHMSDVGAVGKDLYGEQLNLCVWNKSNAGMGSLYRSKHELVFVYLVGSAPHFNSVELGKHGRNRTNVWDYASVNTAGSRRNDLDLHPTVKPVGMIADALKDVTRRREVVLDVFLGSGSTLIAAERISRQFRGIEIDPAYVDIALERWEAMTGKVAVLERRAEP